MIESMITGLALFNPEYIVNWFLSADAITVYMLVFTLMVVESSFIPFPSEIVVPPAAYLACTSGEISISFVVLLATMGAIGGALINYGLSVWIGRPIVYRFADSRLGHACLIDRAKVENAERYFEKHGAVSTFIGRLIPAVRQLISIPAGLSRMNLGKFTIYTGLGAGVWNIVLASLGWWLGTMVSREALLESINKYNHYLTYAGLALGAFCVAYIAYQAFKPKHKNSIK